MKYSWTYNELRSKNGEETDFSNERSRGLKTRSTNEEENDFSNENLSWIRNEIHEWRRKRLVQRNHRIQNGKRNRYGTLDLSKHLKEMVNEVHLKEAINLHNNS